MSSAYPKRGPDAGAMDQIRPQSGSWQQTTLTLDCPTCPLEPHQVVVVAPTPDRSKIPAKGCRKWKEGLTNNGPLQKPGLCVEDKKLTIDGGNQSSDGGLLLLRAAERKLGVCRRLAAAMPDRRDPERVRHAMFEMVMARASAIACGYEDATLTGCGTIL